MPQHRSSCSRSRGPRGTARRLAPNRNGYVEATVERQAELATAADALIAQNSASNPIYEGLVGVGVLILSLVMLKGVFARSVAWLGVATCAGAFLGLSLYPILDIGYFWWWMLFNAWFLAVEWRLHELGSRRWT